MSDKNSKPRAGFVYLMRNNKSGLIKIGFSSKPEKREKEIKTKQPDAILIFSGAATICGENALHRMFGVNRIHGEWFKLSEDQIQKAKEIVITGSFPAPILIEYSESELDESAPTGDDMLLTCDAFRRNKGEICGYRWAPRPGKKAKRCPKCQSLLLEWEGKSK